MIAGSLPSRGRDRQAAPGARPHRLSGEVMRTPRPPRACRLSPGKRAGQVAAPFSRRDGSYSVRGRDRCPHTPRTPGTAVSFLGSSVQAPEMRRGARLPTPRTRLARTPLSQRRDAGERVAAAVPALSASRCGKQTAVKGREPRERSRRVSGREATNSWPAGYRRGQARWRTSTHAPPRAYGPRVRRPAVASSLRLTLGGGPADTADRRGRVEALGGAAVPTRPAAAPPFVAASK